MNKYKILIPDRSTEVYIEKKTFGSNYELITANAIDINEISDELWESCDGILAWHDFEYTREIISKLSRCKGIVRIGTGFDNIDLEAASEKGIVVSNVPDYGTNDVADHTWALILALERGILRFNHSILEGGPWSWELGTNLERIQGKTLGIIGLGRIGTSVAMRGKAFGMKVVFYDPYIPIGIEKSLNIDRAHQLTDLLVESEIVTIHTPLTDETKGMVDMEFFNEMKSGSSICNTARGEIIVMDDLYIALKENKIKWAGLDVLEIEPIDYNHPLIKAWCEDANGISGRLVITPHTAFYNKQSYDEIRRKAAEELKRIIENKNPRSQVNYSLDFIR
jgi:lactate dehydrogenase-like 2-hydroxyacid dehydrogenase